MREARLPLASAAMGVLRLREIASAGRITVLMDRRHPEGTRAFFPTILALKTPLLVMASLAFSLLIVLAHFGRPTRRRAEALAARHWPIVYLAGIVGLTLLSRSTIGWRYLIPAVPFLLCLAAWGAGEALRTSVRGPLLVGAAFAALVALLRVGDGVAFFNAPARLLAQPHRIAADSNLDWGQGLRQLEAAEWREALAEPGLEGALFAPNPRGYGFDLAPLSGPADVRERPYLLSQTEFWGLGATPWEWVEPLHATPPSMTTRDGAYLYWRQRR
jgi:hypothetical protein